MQPMPGDPVANRFDRLLALVGYGLLVASMFTFWVSALVAAAIAFAHRRGADGVVASHFRFQLIVFAVGTALLVLAVGAFLGAGGFALGALVGLAGSLVPEWGWSAAAASGAGASAGLLALAGLAVLILDGAWLLIASLWGLLRLASDRPIGQWASRQTLEPR